MPRRVIVEMQPNKNLAGVAFDASTQLFGAHWESVDRVAVAEDAVKATAAPAAAGFRVDMSFPPTPVPELTNLAARAPSVIFTLLEDPFDVRRLLPVDIDPLATPYIVRGEVDDEGQIAALEAQPNVLKVYTDPMIEACRICPGSPPVGTDQDVARLLCTDKLAAAGMDGRGVLLAIVDTGINLAHLKARGKNPRIDRARSWEPVGAVGDPFEFPVGHGTMCAYDALIAAPEATLLDIAVLLSRQASRPGESPVSGLLSDAILAYSHLLRILQSQTRRPGEAVSLVVSNSWGIFSPDWDFEPDHKGNYTDNSLHPFNRIVATLESFGADILFAVGNCGADCADRRCQWPAGQSTIGGANSHAAVLSVAGVDVTGERVGYSSTGPGRLADRKPDISGFTHFRGSGVYAADGGTSAACPVVAGVVAAVRSRLPSTTGEGKTSPAALRDMLCKTAVERGNPGYDYAYGWGIVNGCRLSEIVPGTVTTPAENTAEAVANLEAEIRGITAAPVPAFLLTADTGVKTVIVRVTSDAEIKEANIGVRADPPVPLNGSNPKSKSAEVTTNSLGVLLFDFEVNMGFPGRSWILTLTEKSSGKAGRTTKGVTGPSGTGHDTATVEF